jgi:calcium-dependent protein kinase
MAPEVIKGFYNARCDIWSVGIITHTMLVGVPPFDDKDTAVLLKKIRDSHQIGMENRKWQMRSVGSVDLTKKLL